MNQWKFYWYRREYMWNYIYSISMCACVCKDKFEICKPCEKGRKFLQKLNLKLVSITFCREIILDRLINNLFTEQPDQLRFSHNRFLRSQWQNPKWSVVWWVDVVSYNFCGDLVCEPESFYLFLWPLWNNKPTCYNLQ